MAAVGRRPPTPVEGLQQDLSNDLRLISNEAKKKHPDVREAAERCLMHLRKVSYDQRTFTEALHSSDQLVPSLLYCCDCKQPRVVELALGALQRLVKRNLLPKGAAESVIGTLRNLLVAGVEEVRVVQTLLLVVSVPDVVGGRVLGKAFLLAVALRESRNPTLSHTASAAVSQMVSSAFDRAGKTMDDKTVPAPQPIVDAFSLFQDICLVTNGDKAMWLPQTPKLGRLLGLELIESSLKNYPSLFLKRPEFAGLVKERVCPLVIKLFSPTTKTKDLSGTIPPPSADKPHFAVFVRLMRIVSVLVSQFFSTLVTECEIFLTLLVKFMETEKPLWQQILAVEAVNLLAREETLIRGFCQHYDMQEHSSRILAELVDALGGFIQCCFINPPAQGQQGVGPGPDEETPAYYTVRNVSVPVYHLPPSTATKPLMMEGVDKSEATLTPEGYPLAVAVDALMNLINSIVRLSGGESTPSSPTTPPSTEKDALRETLLSSSWSGSLAALSLLLEACGDEMLRENILKAHLSYIHLCGRCGMLAPRDAFLTSLCKVALPAQYAMTLVTGPTTTAAAGSAAGDSPTADQGFTYVFGDSSAKTRDRQGQLGRVGVAWDDTHHNQVGSGEGEGGGKMRLSKSASGAHSGNSPAEAVELTSKRLQCIRSLVNLAQCYAEDLGRGWRILLQTLHHLTHVLGLQPQSNGALLPVRRALDASAMALPSSPGKKSALSMLCDLLSNLFESSQHFSGPALGELIDALEQVSKDNEDSNGTAGTLCMFSEAKILEVTLANFPRLELILDKVITHFMRGTESTNKDVRMYCCNAVVMVTKVGLSRAHDNDPSQTKRFLHLLSGLQRSSFEDVHICLLTSLTDILHSCGEKVGSNWNEVLGIICDVANSTSEQLVRRGFQALQLVISDYLPALPTSEVPLCIIVTTKFALQQVDINISLTAVALLWTVADHLFHTKVAVAAAGNKGTSKMSPLPSDVVAKIPNVATPPILSPFLKSSQSPTPQLADRLWLLLFACLSDLCADPRAAVRKSASQTLFSTVTAHGTVLEDQSWGVVLWMVLFPLLELVRERTQSASTLDLHATFLIHHTRNTAQKQWAESQVLTLSGVSRLFQSRWLLLRSLEAFGRMWSKYCSVVATYAQSPYEEVLLAVLKSIRDLMVARLEDDGTEEPAIWARLWEVWRDLATPTGLSGCSGGGQTPQNVLVEYLLVFLPLSARLHGSWRRGHVEELRRALKAALVVPVPKDTSPFLCPSPSSEALSALQHVCLLCLVSLYCDSTTSRQLAHMDSVDRGLHKPLPLEQVREYYPVSEQGEVRGVVLETLLELIQLATSVTPAVSSCHHFGPFVKSALVHSVHLFESHDCHMTSRSALENFLVVLQPLLCSRLWLQDVAVWKDCHSILVELTRWAGQHSTGGVTDGAWQQLMSTLREYLTAAETDSHTAAAEVERMDVELVQAIQTHLVPVVVEEGPGDVVQELSEILSQGSTHIVKDPLKSSGDGDWFRESFSRHCFDALLQLSVATTRSRGTSSSAAVLGHWVSHCRESLEVFSREEAVSGGVPLPRARVTDVLTTLHSIMSLVTALKERPDRVAEVWAQVCKLYPTLVTCVSCDSREVRDALKMTLLQFTFIVDAFTQKLT